MEIKINLYLYQKLLNIIEFEYDPQDDKSKDYEGFLIGKINESKIEIVDLKLGPVEFGDINLKMAIVEDEVYSTGSGNYVVGMIKTHNSLGLAPNPGDLFELSTLQSVNPSMVLLIVDIQKIKINEQAEEFGLSFYQLESPTNPDGNLNQVKFKFEDYNKNGLISITSNLKINKIPLAQIDALVNKALANVQTNDFVTAERFLRDAQEIIGDRFDPEITEKVDLNLLEIEYRRRLYPNVIKGLEIIKKKCSGSNSENLMGEMTLLLARVMIQLGKRDAGLQAFDEAVKKFNNSRNWKRLAFTHLLRGLVILPMKGAEPALICMFEGLSAISNLRSDSVKDNLINTLNLERNAKNLIKTLHNKQKQNKYLEMLNEVSEKHGYKINLSL